MRTVLTNPPYNSLAASTACNPVGVNEINNSSSISISPNPSSGNFTINNAKGEIIISNIFGEKIFQQKLLSEKSEIDFSNSPNGIYFISTMSPAQVKINAKLIISK